MAKYNYSKKIVNNDNTAKAVGREFPISTKQSIEICNFIRNLNVEKAKIILNKVIKMEQAVPVKRFTGGVGHKKSIGPGRYPIKACGEILKLLEGAVTNAQFKGLNATSLVIVHISAQKGAKRWHYGRQRRRQSKRTSIEIVLEETEKKKEEKTVKKGIPKVEKKEEVKEAPKKEEVEKVEVKKPEAPKVEEKKSPVEEKKVEVKPKEEIKAEAPKLEEVEEKIPVKEVPKKSEPKKEEVKK